MIKVTSGVLTVTDTSQDKSGKITGGNTQNYGGGILVGGTNAEFVLSEGTICGNAADKEGTGGGGIVVIEGKLTICGGTVSGNSANYGGGIFKTGEAPFTINCGTIMGNTAKFGGGIHLETNLFMHGGEITGNETSGEGLGGGVYYSCHGTFVLSGGAITRNVAAGDGGGIYQENQGTMYSFIIHDGEIADNMAAGNGG